MVILLLLYYLLGVLRVGIFLLEDQCRHADSNDQPDHLLMVIRIAFLAFMHLITNCIHVLQFRLPYDRVARLCGYLLPLHGFQYVAESVRYLLGEHGRNYYY